MKVFPLCRKVTLGDMLAGVGSGAGVLSVSEGDLIDLAEIAFLCAKATEPDLTREAFDALPVTPPELIDAFLVARYQTGAWLPPGTQEPGEEKGAASPPPSISIASSPS